MNDAMNESKHHSTTLTELRKQYPTWSFHIHRFASFDGGQWQAWAKNGKMGDRAWVQIRSEGETRSEALEVLVAKMREIGVA